MSWLDTPNTKLPKATGWVGVETPRQCLGSLMIPAYVDEWLETPNSAFGGKTPRVIADERPELLEQMIWQLATGTFS
jgi:hypothetical protein